MENRGKRDEEKIILDFEHCIKSLHLSDECSNFELIKEGETE